MPNLNNVKWNQFKIKDIFDIENCRCSNVSKLNEGNISYIGATNRNNGVLKFVQGDSLLQKGNCIVFICDGDGSIGYSIYKKEDFIGSTTLKIGRNINLNKYNALFITTIADTVRQKYNFGFKRNEKHLKNEIILLPVDEKDYPDWNFMELYIKEKEKSLLTKYNKYIKNKLNHLKKDLVLIEDDLRSKEWKEFKINKIFSDLQRGKRLKKEDHINGMMPFVSALGINNGVDNYVSNKEDVRIFSNCLTLANTGNSAGSCFYQPFEFVASDHVTMLANNNFNRYIYLFIGSVLSRLSEKYGFSREISNKRLEKEKIMLPIDNDGNPDWDFMESYMKKLEYEKISEYLNYIENRDAC